jgi:hypothetical protein
VKTSLLLLLIGVSVARLGAAPANDCYFAEQETRRLLGNSKIEIRLDARNGGIAGLLNKTSERQLLRGDAAEVFLMQYSTGNLAGALDKVHALGLAASGYINARLCNHETETYKSFGRKWAGLG